MMMMHDDAIIPCGPVLDFYLMVFNNVCHHLLFRIICNAVVVAGWLLAESPLSEDREIPSLLPKFVASVVDGWLLAESPLSEDR